MSVAQRLCVSSCPFVTGADDIDVVLEGIGRRSHSAPSGGGEREIVAQLRRWRVREPGEEAKLLNFEKEYTKLLDRIKTGDLTLLRICLLPHLVGSLDTLLEVYQQGLGEFDSHHATNP